jgi:hypothetical protein
VEAVCPIVVEAAAPEALAKAKSVARQAANPRRARI